MRKTDADFYNKVKEAGLIKTERQAGSIFIEPALFYAAVYSGAVFVRVVKAVKLRF